MVPFLQSAPHFGARGRRRTAVQLRANVAAGLVLCLTASCTHGSSHPGVATTQPAPASSQPSLAPIRSSAVKQLSGQELLYGAGAVPTAGIVYQPDVVLIGGGASAVRAVSGSGLTWTIDANAPGADELAVGKIMLATSFGTGRVLSLTKSGAQEIVVLGPVGLTDVIRDGDIASSAPIPIANPLAYTTPSAPGTVTEGGEDLSSRDPSSGPDDSGPGAPSVSAPSGGTTARSRYSPRGAQGGVMLAQPAIFSVAGQAGPPGPVGLPPPTSAPTTVGAGDFQVTPICCRQLGIDIGYKTADGVLLATVTLEGTPTMTFHLDVSGGVLREASVHLHGVGALRAAIQASTLSNAGNIKGTTIRVPETLAIPFVAFGVPLVLSLNERFYVSMQLIGKAYFHTNGAYRVSGDLGFGYRRGAGVAIADATSLAAQNPFTANTGEVGIAAGVITLGLTLTASISIGLIGFSAGLWYALRTVVTVAADGLSLTAGCVNAGLEVDGTYGVGYRISAAVAAVINFFLSVVKVKPIAASGGPQWGPTVLLKPPPADYCHS